MSTQIFVEKRELRDAAARMGAIINSITNIQRAIGNIDNNNASRWQGRAANQNAQNFRALNTIKTNYLIDARATRTALEQAAAAYDATEQKQVQLVGQLSDRGIF